MTGLEQAVVFQCGAERLFGVLHVPPQPALRGVLMVVGGPQYRVGSHRQFLLLARYLAAHGVPVFRFDYRGMGDSEGEPRAFDRVDDDIRAAVDAFFNAYASLREIVVWGLCDAASAALFYAYRDPRVTGLILLNPWVFTESGAAKTYLKHYYWQRFRSGDFWCKVLKFEFDYKASLAGMMRLLKALFNTAAPKAVEQTAQSAKTEPPVSAELPLPLRMRECLRRFRFPVLLVLSGRDLTAGEFKETVKSDPLWQQLLAGERVTHHELKDADHTFSTAQWRDQVAQWSSAWIKSL
jgi:exosortase A-associated hydrolase 1